MDSTQSPCKYFQINCILPSKSDRYQIKDYLGTGCSGIVTQCIKLSTQEKVAVKVFEEENDDLTEKEVEIQEILQKLEQNEKYFPRLIDSFKYSPYRK